MATFMQVQSMLNRLKNHFNYLTVNEEVIKDWTRHFEHCPPEILFKAFDIYLEQETAKPCIANFKAIALRLAGGSWFKRQVLLLDYNPDFDYNDELQVKVYDKSGHSFTYMNREECIKVNDKWVARIDFCTDRLGISKVKELFNELLPTLSSLSKVMNMRTSDATKYREARQRILELAMVPPVREVA